MQAGVVEAPCIFLDIDSSEKYYYLYFEKVFFLGGLKANPSLAYLGNFSTFICTRQNFSMPSKYRQFWLILFFHFGKAVHLDVNCDTK